MNAFEFKSSLSIGKFKKTANNENAPLMADYSLAINGVDYYFCNNSSLGESGATKWCLISEDGSECYCFDESRKAVLDSLLTSLYLDYKSNL
jgi:hypothetical protein